MSKYNVYLCQVNNRFGSQVFLPYSVGCLQAYCERFEEVNKNFEFRELLYLRDRVAAVLTRLDTPKVFGISCYSWNWAYSMALGDAVKAAYPNCLLVIGGPQVPQCSESFFEKYPYIDLIVHGEGEVAFREILQEFCAKDPNYTEIRGLTVRVENNRSFRTQPRERIDDLSILPSPYLSGVFDEILKSPNRWNVCQETHRGCPYACTFCDWGSSVFTKVRAFNDDRIIQELEWFGSKQVEVLYNCDANYGLLARDLYLTQELAKVKEKYGFPRQFRPAFAKNSDNRVFEIARILHRVNLQKGITLSVQSMDEDCLEAVKRKNIRIENLSELLRRYRAEDIPTYTELILGLPRETYHSFKTGFHKLLVAGQHDGCYVNLCQLLPNSEMSSPTVLERYGIKSIAVPMLLAYSTPAEDGIQEYFEIVVETDSMSVEDWKKSFLFAWTVQLFHCLNLTQYLAVFFWIEMGITYDDFYESMLQFARGLGGQLLHRQYALAEAVASRILGGCSPEVVLPEFGSTIWLSEEAAFLSIVTKKCQFYEELKPFLDWLCADRAIALPPELLSDLILYQESMLVDPFSSPNSFIVLHYDFHNYFKNAYDTKRISLARTTNKLYLSNEAGNCGDLETFALEFVRYGRKSNKLHTSAMCEESMICEGS